MWGVTALSRILQYRSLQAAPKHLLRLVGMTASPALSSCRIIHQSDSLLHRSKC